MTPSRITAARDAARHRPPPFANRCHAARRRPTLSLLRKVLLTIAVGLITAAGFAQVETVTIPATGVGTIPDRGTAGCGPPAGAPLVLSYDASGVRASGADLQSVEVDLDFTHNWIGDVTATLAAPDGTEHVLFARTGATTPTGCGDSSDANGVYSFSDTATGDWWAEASLQTGGADLAMGSYRTSSPGGTAGGGALTNMTSAFSGISNVDGTWTLTLTDSGGGEQGTVLSSSLFLAYRLGAFPGTGTGAVPDRGTAGCGPPAGPPLVVSFDVAGIEGTGADLESIEVDIDVTHNWLADLSAELTAPDGLTSHTLFSRTGATTPTGCGDSSDLNGVYTFSDASFGDWWSEAAAITGGADLPTGRYRTSSPGGSPSGGSPTNMATAFAGIASANGTWTLELTDSGGGETGFVSAATLFIVGPPPELVFRNGFELPPP
ncbi:MAG: proprotein convertase P-domain-containing protein [Xanthomonadales bacterium]|nr:proprotein convertase P-domain-containing protein [Xanthomonadales bacterium]